MHWCKHCSWLEVSTNLRKFPFTAPGGIAAGGVVCRPVLDGTAFAPTKGLHFQALHPLSFLFICTLHWCKHCTGLDVARNLLKIPFTPLCGIGADEVVCRSAHDGAPFVPTRGLHVQALHPLSFLFIYTLDWCKHCAMLEVFPNLRKFPFTALCGIAAGGVVCRAVIDGALFAATQGLHFQALHHLSFLFLCTLHWCNGCTVLEAPRSFANFH